MAQSEDGKPDVDKEAPAAEPRKIFSASNLKITPPRTASDIRRAIAEGRFAEMDLDQAGLDE